MNKEAVISNLRIPGPTPCPEEVLKALSTQMVNHRGPEFTLLHTKLVEKLKMYFQTKNDLLIITGSGTYGFETSIANTLSPKDHVLAVSVGFFGDRFTEVGEAFKLNVHKLGFEWGKAADPEKIEQVLKKNKKIKAVLITHNETSTGITNPLKDISAVVKKYDKLLLVDAVSSLSCIDLETDKWKCDVVFTGSQKGWMIPPGVFFISISREAWKAYEKSSINKYVLDFKIIKDSVPVGHTPFTPAVSLFYALDKALDLMDEEGFENILARHIRIGEKTRQGVLGLGLELFADINFTSNTVTAIKAPKGVHPKKIYLLMRKEGVEIAMGPGKVADQIFRIGHMGYVKDEDIDKTLDALRRVLKKL